MGDNFLAKNKRISMIAMLSCLSFVGRMTFSFLPNVQPTTVIILIITLHLGKLDGLIVAIVSIVISNLYLGMGIWTIAQIISYSFLVLLFHRMSKVNMPRYEIYLSVLAMLSGFLYGLIISLVQAPFFGWNIFIPYYLSGIPYDISHAVGNYVFFMILNPVLKQILANYEINQKNTY